MRENIIVKLTSRNDKYAYSIADKIISESLDTDEWYEYFDDLASLLNHPKSLVKIECYIYLLLMLSGMKKTL